MKGVKCLQSYSKTLIKLLTETSHQSFSRSNMECKVLANYINISLRFATTPTKIWKHAFEQWRHMLKKKELIHGSEKLLLFCLWIQRLIFKNHSGEWNTTWTLLELSITQPSSLRSKRCLIISENTMNLICSDLSWWSINMGNHNKTALSVEAETLQTLFHHPHKLGIQMIQFLMNSTEHKLQIQNLKTW